MGRLTEIKTEIGALLSAITTANGFSFNFGTVNQPDRAKVVSFPSANIKLKSETPASDIAVHHGYDVCLIEIELFCRMSAVNTVPLQSYDIDVDTVITAIKKKFRANLGSLPITGDGILRYKGWRIDDSVAGDVFAPYKVILFCEVEYNANE